MIMEENSGRIMSVIIIESGSRGSAAVKYLATLTSLLSRRTYPLLHATLIAVQLVKHMFVGAR